MDKRHILDAIKRIATANGGKAPGRQSFERETGIRGSEWYPHLWLRWGDALVEAGYAANPLVTAISDEVIIQRDIDLARELNKLPVHGEIRRKARSDKTFPSHTVFQRLGSKETLIDSVVRYCQKHPGHEDVIALCTDHIHTRKRSTEASEGAGRKIVTGFVYLMKSGRHYKIGRTVSVGRREREFAIQIPVPPTTVHSVETDDPVGIEAYWHKRFADKRGEGEWFDLSPEDVRAFKRWKRIV